MDTSIDKSELVETEMDDTSTMGDASANEPPESMMTYINDLDEQMLIMRQKLNETEELFLGMRRTMKHIDAVVEDVRRLGRSQEERGRQMMASLINRGSSSFNETAPPTASTSASSTPTKDNLTSANNTAAENVQTSRHPQGYNLPYPFLPADLSQCMSQFGVRILPPRNPESAQRVYSDTETIDALEAFRKLKLTEPLSPDQLKMFLDDVRSKHKVDEVVRSYTADKAGLIEQLSFLYDILKARCQECRFLAGPSGNFDPRLMSRLKTLISSLRIQ